MFDMGFEPQISRILQNIQPNRQTVLFSATFPRAVCNNTLFTEQIPDFFQIEATVRRILKSPVEISVRGVSVVSDTIEQHVEVLNEEDKARKLLTLVADWYEKGSVLVFVDRQESCDAIWQQVMGSGYKCSSLHGGKDQMDRDFTIKDFKEGNTKIMIATSVAARGLDVPHLRLVVNYDVPNHLEDYVHRVGRTGRAGNKGTSYTFITPEEEEYSRDIVKALRSSNAPVPEALQRMFDEYERKRTAGSAKKRKVCTAWMSGGEAMGIGRGEASERSRGQSKVRFSRPFKSGYGGQGFKFNEAEQAEKERQRKLQRMAAGVTDEDDEAESNVLDDDLGGDKPKVITILGEDGLTEVVLGKGTKVLTTQETTELAAERIKLFAQEIAAQPGSIHDGVRFTDEIEINDYPKESRWKVTHKDALASITEFTGTPFFSLPSLPFFLFLRFSSCPLSFWWWVFLGRLILI
jgi:ATP-dependent RNA helicase DDX46/PRP5